MAGSLNKVILIGNVGADPEIKKMVNSIPFFGPIIKNVYQKTKPYLLTIFIEGQTRRITFNTIVRNVVKKILVIMII